MYFIFYLDLLALGTRSHRDKFESSAVGLRRESYRFGKRFFLLLTSPRTMLRDDGTRHPPT
jgi:hypothetical protein